MEISNETELFAFLNSFSQMQGTIIDNIQLTNNTLSSNVVKVLTTNSSNCKLSYIEISET